MPDAEHPALFRRLPAAERLALAARCERLHARRGERLLVKGHSHLHVHFPVNAAVSLLSPGNSRHLEVLLVGNEGMLGGELALGVGEAPWDAVVSVGGELLRLGIEDFRRELTESARLRDVVALYHWVLAADLAHAVACARFHTLEQRLSRWLLMASDRCGGAALGVTHAQISALLGVRRAGVTRALKTLQQEGGMALRRGGLQVLDAPRLTHLACACHAQAEARYERTFAGQVRRDGREKGSIFHNPAIFIR